MTTAAPPITAHVDVLVVGAGLSGIGAGHYLQTECPWATYAIFEARDAIGGTWDLFRYPGIRSDSDMYTLGYSFRPWDGEKSIADGDSILQYIKDTAAESGIDAHIRFDHRIAAADWSTRRSPLARHRRAGPTPARPSSSPPASSSPAPATTATTTATCPTSRAWTDFAGTIVHPQAWPDDLDVTGQADRGDRQRGHRRHPRAGAGPLGRPRDHAAALADLHRLAAREEPGGRPAAQAPAGEAGRRGRQVVPRPDDAGLLPGQPPVPAARQAPAAEGPGAPAPARATTSTPTSRRSTTRGTSACARCPNGDLFKAIRDGTSSVVTDHIERFTETGLRLDLGRPTSRPTSSSRPPGSSCCSSAASRSPWTARTSTWPPGSPTRG